MAAVSRDPQQARAVTSVHLVSAATHLVILGDDVSCHLSFQTTSL
jgi:hypothetical protein